MYQPVIIGKRDFWAMKILGLKNITHNFQAIS